MKSSSSASFLSTPQTTFLPPQDTEIQTKPEVGHCKSLSWCTLPITWPISEDLGFSKTSVRLRSVDGCKGVRTASQFAWFMCVCIWEFCCCKKGVGGVQACSESMSGCKTPELELMNVKQNWVGDYLCFRNCTDRIHTYWAVWLAAEQSSERCCLYPVSMQVPLMLV